MAVDDVLDDGEAEAGAADGARARRVDPVEALGQARQMHARNPWAVVAHRERHAGAAPPLPPARAVAPQRDRDPPAFAAVLHRVVEQVGDHLGKLVRIAGDVRQPLLDGECERHTPRGEAWCERLRPAAGKHGEIELARGRGVFGEFDARQAQEVVDQPAHPRRLFGHDREEPRLRLAVVRRRPA